LALRLGCTVQELGARMTAEEFGEWRVYLEREGLTPAQEATRDALLIASTMNGPMQRRDKKPWTPAHILPADPWSTTPPAPAKRVPPTAAQLRAQVASLNARRRNGRS
jgi:hypothetical protein